MKTINIIKAFFLFLFLILLLLVIVIFRGSQGGTLRYIHKIHDLTADSLAGGLVMEKPWPAVLTGEKRAAYSLIYVLGGNQESLTSRFSKASSLYHHGLSRKILILSRPGITEYSPELGRNLTNDEWSIRELEKFNVRAQDIEPIKMPKRFFGTLGEASSLAAIIRERGCRNLILVTSEYHTRRVFSTFSRNLTYHSVNLYIYGSGDTAILVNLIAERIKLFIYDHVVLPACYERRTTGSERRSQE